MEKIVKKAAVYSSLLIGILFLFWALTRNKLMINQSEEESFKTVLLVIGCLWLLLGLLFILIKGIPANLSLTLATFNFLYLSIEIIFYFLTCFGIVQQPKEFIFGSIDMFNQPCARYDSLSGYKWYGEHARATNIERGTLLYDVRLTINNRGYFSGQDYNYHKSDSTIRRYIVFGDSFTGPYFLEKPWPDRLQEIMDSVSGKRSFEFYNFALDGVGVVNWYYIFINEILPYYDFDGLVIASFGNNLDREYGIRHHTDTLGYFHYFDTIPSGFAEFKKHIPDMWVSHFIMSDKAIEERIKAEVNSKTAFKLQPPDLYFLLKLNYFLNVEYKVYQMNKEFERRFKEARDEQLEYYKLTDYVSQYGEKKFQMIDSILSYCKNNKKEVVLCSIPYEEGILQNKSGNTTGAQIDVEFLAQHYGMEYFDGYQVFYDLTLPELSSCFLKYDSHWNQKGSDFFAEGFSKFFLNKRLHHQNLQP